MQFCDGLCCPKSSNRCEWHIFFKNKKVCQNIGNLAELLAALGVFGTGTDWPDVIVATVMVGLALQGASTVIGQAVAELRQPVGVPAE